MPLKGNSMTLVGKFDGIMGTFEDINGKIRGHYWENSRTIIGISDGSNGTLRGY